MTDPGRKEPARPASRPRRVRAFAPATVGNIACGYDVLGLALEAPGDTVIATLSSRPGVRITRVTGDGGRVPRDADRNTAGLAAQVLLRGAGPQLSSTCGIDLELEKSLPLAGGMGGSAASAVAAAVAVDALLELGASPDTLLMAAGQGESGAAGAPHLDNAAPALLGGICLTLPPPPSDPVPDRTSPLPGASSFASTTELADTTADPPHVVSLPVPDGLSVALVHPRIQLPTRESRQILGTTVPLSRAIAQWGNTAGFVAALYRGDLELLARTVVDHVAEPHRAALVPGFHKVKAAGLAAGGLAASLSGAGPSIFALCPELDTAQEAAQAMVDAFRAEADIPAQGFASPVSSRGAHLLPDPLP